MKKKILSVLTAALISVLSCSECLAAEQLPISYANKYMFVEEGGGFPNTLSHSLVTIL